MADAVTPGRRLAKLAGTHALVLVAALSLFAAADSWSAISGLGLATLLCVITGALAGVTTATLVHEWFHYLGARYMRANFTVPARQGLFVFNWDFAGNTPRQFLIMSVAGNLGGVVAVLLLWNSVPADTLGRAALRGAAIASVIYAALIEWPVIRRARRSGDPLAELSKINQRRLSRSFIVASMIGILMTLSIVSMSSSAAAEPVGTEDAKSAAVANAASGSATAPTARFLPRSFEPGKVRAGSETTLTVSSDDFRFDDVVPVLSIVGVSAITFSDISVLDAHTLTARMSVPASVANKRYLVAISTPGGGPGAGAGSTKICLCLTVADPDPPADLVDIAAAIGLPSGDTTSAGILVDDLNQDSFADFLFITHAPTPELLFLGDGHAVASSQIMQPADRHECDSADVNSDGRIDMYCSVGAERGKGVKVNNLWLRQANGTYIDEAEKWGVTDPYGRGRDVVFLHANKDNLPDLFVSNWGPRGDGISTANRLFLNQGGTSFSATPDFGVDAELPSYCAHSADFDNDGDDDLLVCGNDRVRMYENQAGTGFVDVARKNGFTQPFTDADFADIDGDGDLDIAFATEKSFEIHRLDNGVDDGVVFMQSVQSGKSVAFGDINGDGKPDAYFVQRGCRAKRERNLPDILAVNQGATFTILNPPAMNRGCGDAVAAFDIDGDGTDGFLVGNGRGKLGPLQYLVLPDPAK